MCQAVSSLVALLGSPRCRSLQTTDTGSGSAVDSLQHSCLISQFILDVCVVGYDCGFLDLAQKRGQKTVVCCVGEPKLSLQGVEKK